MKEKRNQQPLRAFGALLKEKRLKARLKLSAMSDVMIARGLKASDTLLSAYEQGKYSNPNHEILKVWAELTGWAYEEVVCALVEVKYNVKVIPIPVLPSSGGETRVIVGTNELRLTFTPSVNESKSAS